MDSIEAWVSMGMAVGTFFMAVTSAMSVREMKKSRIAADRPYVVPSVQVRRSGLICLVVANAGRGLASHVTVSIPDELQKALQGKEAEAVTRLGKVRETLAPGQEHIYTIGTSVTVKLPELSASDIRISYCDARGKKYAEVVTMDFPSMGPRLMYGTELSEAVKPLREEIKKLAVQLEQLNRKTR